MIVHRNEPCPCNSGLKTKKCCAQNCCETCLFSPENLDAVKKGWLLNQSLVRCNGKHHLPFCKTLSEFRPKTVVICGNGSAYWRDPNCPETESDVWGVVRECVAQIKATPEGSGIGIPSNCMNFLHYLSAVEKVVSYVTKEWAKDNEQYIPIQQVLTSFRNRLGASLQKAEIHLRDIGCFHCGAFHAQVLNKDNRFGYITLNWDGAIRKLQNTIELHGNRNLPETLILPNQDLIRLLPQDRITKPGFEAFAVAHHWLANCKNLIIWGCGLNDYDAMILVILSIFSLTKHNGQIGIFISNPCPNETKRIEEKLKDFIPSAVFYKCINQIES